MYGTATINTSPSIASGANQLMSKAPEQMLDRVGKSIGEARSQVRDLEQRARSIADAVFGSMPETANGDNVGPPSVGKADAIERDMRWLFETIGELRTQIDRLTCI
jgi:methyl-accepting chemotaxis protein